MSQELRQLSIAFTVRSPEHLPLKDGEQMYADDVQGEFSDVIGAAVTAWYEARGHILLACEPTL